MGSALICFVFYEAVSWVRVGKGCTMESPQEQLQKMSLYSAMINSKPTLSQDAGEQNSVWHSLILSPEREEEEEETVRT